jgi:hypothetical protein
MVAKNGVGIYGRSVRVVIEFRSEKVEEELEKVDDVWLCWATTAGFAEARLLSQPGDFHSRILTSAKLGLY